MLPIFIPELIDRKVSLLLPLTILSQHFGYAQTGSAQPFIQALLPVFVLVVLMLPLIDQKSIEEAFLSAPFLQLLYQRPHIFWQRRLECEIFPAGIPEMQ
jgi:hypothetical protein